jgi:SH3 domain protein
MTLSVKKFPIRWVVLGFSLFCLTLTAQAKTFFVTQIIEVTIREGPGTEFTAIKNIKSGDAVELLEGKKGNWVEVRLKDGTTGWLSQKILTETPPPASPKAPPDQQAEIKSLRGQLHALSEENTRLKKDLAPSEPTLLNQENFIWFLTGAGVLFLGLLMGLFMGRRRRRIY